MKPDKCRGKRKEAHYNYLSSDFQYHRSTKAAVAHMKTLGMDDAACQRLISKTHDEGKKLRPDKYDWIEGDESVPEGEEFSLNDKALVMNLSVIYSRILIIHFLNLNLERKIMNSYAIVDQIVNVNLAIFHLC